MRLTPREDQVARLVGEGLSYKAIGHELGISARTVEHHVHRLARLVGDSEKLTPYRRVCEWVRREFPRTA
jgi:DNA-binding NarL/FixJ family response regulator